MTLDESEYSIEVTRDPFRIFFMGTLFDTCLSIPSGMYNKSVLANAYEGNKAVLFVFDADNNPVARKLVAINEKWEIIGYRIYCSLNEVTANDLKNIDALKKLINEFCGAWAASCN